MSVVIMWESAVRHFKGWGSWSAGLGECVCAAIMSGGSLSHIPKDGLHFGELECLPHSRDTDPGRIRVACNMKLVKLRACT